MFRANALALYKNRPVLVLEVRDRIEIKLEDGSSLRVRDKDIALLHGGPVTRIPEAASGGDFDTARAMIANGGESAATEAVPVTWEDLAELVFGVFGPAESVACWAEAAAGNRFRLVEGRAYALSDGEVAREAEKKARKEGEATERSGFIERAKRARASKKAKGAEPAPIEGAAFLASDERFLSEIEALALGKSAKSRAALDLGLAETPEAAHAFLLAIGRWDETVNPHPSRAACPLHAPRVEIGPDLGDLPRADLKALKSWAIDNAWSKDPDDAIAWDGSSVWVHVADPASAISVDSPADREAFARGSTLYLPELTAPMLADEALERFGLGLREESPALSFRIRVAQDGSIAEVETLASLVKVRRSSYSEADAIMARGEAPELQALAEVAARRAARRIANGAIEIEIPEVRIHVEKDPDRAGLEGTRIEISSIPKAASSGIVREMMLLAGEAAARWAFERGLPYPYYGQESPSEGGAVAQGEGLAAQFAKRRLMRGGISGPTPTSHRGLGLPFYAQATSPLRRYQDLLGHMQIRAALAGRPALDADEVGRRCALAQAASAATRQAERSSDLHWTIAYLLRNPAWTGAGYIVGGSGSGAQVYIPELGLETRMKLGSGRELDEKLELRLVRVDLAKLDTSFDEIRRS